MWSSTLTFHEQQSLISIGCKPWSSRPAYSDSVAEVDLADSDILVLPFRCSQRVTFSTTHPADE